MKTALLLLLSIPVWGQLLDHTGITFAPGSVVTLGINATGASILVMGVGSGQDSTTCTVSDSLSNTWQSIQNYGNPPNIAIWYSWHKGTSPLATGVSQTATVTCGTSGSTNTVTFAAYTGTRTSSDPLDVHVGTAFSFTNNSVQPGSITPRTSSELIITSVAAVSTNLCTINAGFTITDCPVSGGTEGAQAYLLQSAGASVGPTWTIATGFGVAQGLATIASFFPPPAPTLTNGSKVGGVIHQP